ncbi:MAG TPA: Bax inhibitor-1 family protein [Candidatus Azoamicus sp. OHIO2]
MNNNHVIMQIKNKELVDINKVMKNTFMLLSSTIAFSTFTALIGIIHKNSYALPCFIISFLLLFFINVIKQNAIRLFLVFIITGLLGYSTGPLINFVLHTKNGEELIFMSLFITAGSFFLLSIYTIITKKNFQFLNSFLFIGFIIIVFCILSNIIFNIHILHLIISGFIIISSAATILYTLSEIIHSNEHDYISATITLYLQIYNIFLSLLNIFTRKD